MTEQKKLKKVIAFDLDGTLAESKQPMTDEMSKLIYDLAGKTRVAIISGGSIQQFQNQFLPKILEVATDSAQDIKARHYENIILLPTSGSARFEYEPSTNTWQETFNNPFPEDIKEAALIELNKIVNEKAAEFDIPPNHYGEYIENRGTQITLSALGQQAPLEEKSLWDPTGEKRLKIKEALEQAVPGINARVGGTTSVDILPKGFDKAAGLKLLLEYLRLDLEDLFFVGDAVFEGGNDYSPVLAGIETLGIKGPDEAKDLIKALLQV